MNIENPENVRIHVRDHYSKLAENAASKPGCGCAPVEESCCTPSKEVPIESIENLIKFYDDEDTADLPEDITDFSLGCGDPVTLASLQPGQVVVDLGSGGGLDCFLAAKKVAPDGKVIGVDMTPTMLDKARVAKEAIGLDNVEFRLGEIEHLPIPDSYADVIISNCVINLSPDKPQVIREAFRVLRPGGRFAVSDIATDGPLPDVIKESLSAWAGCVSGALDIKEYAEMLEDAGFIDVSIVPEYWGRETIDSAVKQVGLEDTLKGKRAVMIISDGREAKTIELDPDTLPDKEGLSKSVFSAKITAYKPE